MMDPCILRSPLSSFLNAPSFPFTSPKRHRFPSLRATGPAATSSDADGNTKKEDNPVATTTTSSPPPPAPRTLQIRYRSKRQARQQQEVATRPKPPPPKKEWESMTLGEKTVELYVGEKGLLFWLNKFAYASIFVIIGAWILFRFVGPSLGLYQLDADPLPPTSLFKGTSPP